MLDKPDLRAFLASDPAAVVETVAADYKVTCRAVVEALPEAMRRITGPHFADAMADIASWGEVTVIVHTEDGIMEFTGPVPEGKVSHGYFNLMSRKGFHGHLRHERCAAIAFVERPFMTRATASVLFLNHDGGIMLKVFVGRDGKGDLEPAQLAKFRDLAQRLAATAG
jgi:putative heme utilization carrier protein HutX